MAVDAHAPLPPVSTQVERLRELGLGLDADLPEVPGALVAIRHDAVPVDRLAALLTRGKQRGFVVEDMTDVDEFVPIPEVDLPGSPLYLVTGIDRGDELLDWRPAEAHPHLVAAGRSPLTLHEGISWVLQRPEALADNRCFMTIGSRKPKPRGGYDARTPALWISRGTGRDGRERRNAPKVGWCWWNNKHTWLGFASCTERLGAGA